MSDSVSEALERLQLRGGEADADNPIDDILDLIAPKRPQVQSQDQLKAHLEKKYLQPSRHFSEDWLNRLQQYVRCPAYPATPRPRGACSVAGLGLQHLDSRCPTNRGAMSPGA